VDVLSARHGLVESPRWHDGRLWFADWLAGEIIRVDDGNANVVARHRSLPLCFDFLPDGRPLLVSGPEHALLELRPDGTTTPYADLGALSQYGCNDIVVDGRGNTYVNNGNFDFAVGPPPGDRAPGFVALVRPDGSAAVVAADDLAFPNGMAVMPDNATLVVAESYRNRLTAFAINADGSLGERRVWADLGDGVPDGICIDAERAVWYADVPNQRCVRVREGGEVLDTVQLDRGGFACMLGGTPAEPRLYIVAAHWPGAQGLADPTHDWDGQALSVPAPAAAAGWPGN
jgi:sugar lactone lactonase YvrE